MGAIKQWLVYITPEDKTEAVECVEYHRQIKELQRENNVIVADPHFRHKADAIEWGNALVDRR